MAVERDFASAGNFNAGTVSGGRGDIVRNGSSLLPVCSNSTTHPQPRVRISRAFATPTIRLVDFATVEGERKRVGDARLGAGAEGAQGTRDPAQVAAQSAVRGERHGGRPSVVTIRVNGGYTSHNR